MKKFLRIALWGFVFLVLGLIALGVLIRYEENWRGARDWAKTKAKWEARGISFDPMAHFPPPVPDAQNVAALPLFDLEPDPENKTMLVPGALKRALHQGDENHPGPGLPSAGYSWQKGEEPDFAKLDANIAEIYGKVFHKPASGDSVAQLETLYPFIIELNSAAAERPFFQLKESYDPKEPWSWSLQLLTSQIGIDRVLSIHALLELNEKRPNAALMDIRTMLKIADGISREPSLVSGLVAVALENIAISSIGEGLARHAWSDAQLAELEGLLADFDPLANYQSVLRGECVAYSLPMFEMWRKKTISGDDTDPAKRSPFILEGWLDQNLAHVANDLLSAAGTSDPKTHRVFVEEAEQKEESAEKGRRPWWGPWNLLSNVSARPILGMQVHFAQAAVWVDEAKIACALERYRLARGSYPAGLDALAPAYIDAVPCDPINGEAYRYRVRADGTFLLYSVGWNQVDDGGVAVFVLPDPHDAEDSPAKHGDWVWPTVK